MMISLRQRLIVAVVAVSIFWPAAFLLERGKLFDVLNGLVVVVGVGVVVTYFRTTLRVFRDPTCSPAQLLLLAITLSWMAVILRIVMVWIWRLLDRSDAFLENVLLAFPLWIFILAGALHLTAHSAGDEFVPAGNLVKLAVALVAGSMLGIGVALSQ